MLQARLLGGERPLLLRTELDWQGHPTSASFAHPQDNRARGDTKVFGRYLVPYLETVKAA